MPQGSAAAASTSCESHASGSGSHSTSTSNDASGHQAAASSSSNGGQACDGHAAAMQAFREHADNTNDIFLVAAQVVANSLIRARAVLASGKHTYPPLLYCPSLLVGTDN